MKSVTCADVVQTQKVYLTAIGIWPQKKRSIIVWVRYTIILLMSLGYVVMNLFEVRKDLKEGDYNRLSTHLSLLFPASLYCFKLVILKWKESDLEMVLNMLEAPMLAPDTMTGMSYMKQAATRSKLLTISFAGSTAATLIHYNLLQLFDSVKLAVRFSYDIGEYATALSIFQATSLVQMGVSNSVLDILAAAFMSIASVELDILNDKLRSSYSIPNNEHKELLKICMQLHTTIYVYVRRLENAFSLIYLSQFLSSIFAICNVTFELVHVINYGFLNFSN